jgi:hypothetical protein
MYDPVLAIAQDRDQLSVTFMLNWTIAFVESADWGDSFSPPVVVSTVNSWADKNWHGVSRDGSHVYIAYNQVGSLCPVRPARVEQGSEAGGHHDRISLALV